MRCVVILLAVGWASSLAWAERVYWTAKGTVTDVTGAGLQALVAADESVDVEFSYDEGALGTGTTAFPGIFGTFNFRQNTELQMEVSIGALTWAGAISSGPSGMPYLLEVTDVQISLGMPERVSPTLSSQFGEVFSAFPGASATQVNALQVVLEDGVSPYDAVEGRLSDIPPGVQIGISNVLFSPCDFTFGSGEIRSGAEKVSFVIDLATLNIGDGAPVPPPAAIDVSIARVAGQVVLSWGAAVDKCYRIQRSSDLQNWSNLIGIVARSESEMYSFSPVGAPDAQYYRVIQLD